MAQPHPVGYARALLAGGAAGVVASAVGLGVVAVFPKPGPPLEAVAGSAFATGVLGGLIYFAWDRLVRRPVLALWVTSLTVATLTSVLVALLPAPAARLSGALVPVAGLAYYVQQVAALVGLGRFTSFRIPLSYILEDTVLHYTTAIVVSLLVPRWARSGRRP